MKEPIDLGFRPLTYFRPQRLEQYLLSQVKGAVLRSRLQELTEAGGAAEIGPLLQAGGVIEDEIRSLEQLHPMFMGGNYLPDVKAGEIEIARLCIASTTFDVTCVYARQVEGAIHYRVVDEYEGETISGPAAMIAASPLSLGELYDFFTGAWSFHAVLQANFDDDLQGMLGFFTGVSKFYPEFDALCRKRVVESCRPSDPVDEGGIDRSGSAGTG